MRFRLLCVGRIREPALASLVQEFARRLARYHALDVVEVPDAHRGDPALTVRDEGERLLRRIGEAENVWLLERTGKEFSSAELAQRLAELERSGRPRLCVVVAGAYGASPPLFERADLLWSLSKLTLLHEWARALALEQLYRAAKIARGEPYHH